MNYYSIISIIIAVIPTIIIIHRYVKNKQDYARINSRLSRDNFAPDILDKPVDEIESERRDNLNLSNSHAFPWEDVEACYDNVLSRSKFKNHDSCPRCNLASNELIWIMFTSPKVTWKQLAGRSGPLSICPQCNIQVQFICQVMN